VGFRVALYAIFDSNPTEIHQLLGLKPSGVTEEFPDSPIAGAKTRSGTYILYVNDQSTYGEDAIRPIADTTRMLLCNVNETVMVSRVAAIRSGREEWAVVHDSSKGLQHLEEHGELPDGYRAIREEKRSLQDKDDESVDHVFDVPVELFVQLGGVRYDADLESDEEQPWHSLVPIEEPKRKRWWPFSR